MSIIKNLMLSNANQKKINNIAISKPRTSKRTRKNGIDGEVRILVGDYHLIEARIEFTTGKKPKANDLVWNVYRSTSRYSIGTLTILYRNLTKQDALDKAILEEIKYAAVRS